VNTNNSDCSKNKHVARFKEGDKSSVREAMSTLAATNESLFRSMFTEIKTSEFLGGGTNVGIIVKYLKYGKKYICTKKM